MVAVLVLGLLSGAAHCFPSRSPVCVTSRRGAMPRMEATGEVAQLEVQLKILQLRAQLAEIEAQQAAPAVSPVPAPAEALVSPPSMPPAPAEFVVSEPTLPAPVVSQAPLPEGETCLGLSGNPKACTEPVDLNELFGGMKPAFSFDVWPSLDKLLQLDTAVPLIGGLAALYIGYVGVSKASEGLRPDDAATTRRKREERERLGMSEWDQEKDNRTGRDGLVAAVLIVVFELVLFNLRNV